VEAKSDVSKGFILSRQWQETEDGQDLIFWLASDQGPIRIQLSAQESVFFIRHSDLEKSTIAAGQSGVLAACRS